MTNKEKNALYESIMNEINSLLEEKIKGRPVKWTRDAVEAYLEEHPDVRTPSDLYNDNLSIYIAAKRQSFLDDIFVNKRSKKKGGRYWTKKTIQNYLNRHPEITTPYTLQQAERGAYMAAYEMDILGELFPENTRRRHHEFKRSSDEYARKIAMKDIQAELRQNRKKAMADINYQSDTDKQMEDLWWPDDETLEDMFFWRCFEIDTKRKYGVLFKWHLNIDDDFDKDRFLKRTLGKYFCSSRLNVEDESDKNTFIDETLSDEKFQALYRKFLVYNKPIDEKIWTLKQFLHMSVMKFLGKFDMLGLPQYDEIESEFPNKLQKTKFYMDKREEVRDQFPDDFDFDKALSLDVDDDEY